MRGAGDATAATPYSWASRLYKVKSKTCGSKFLVSSQYRLYYRSLDSSLNSIHNTCCCFLGWQVTTSWFPQFSPAGCLSVLPWLLPAAAAGELASCCCWRASPHFPYSPYAHPILTPPCSHGRGQRHTQPVSCRLSGLHPGHCTIVFLARFTSG